MTRMKMVFGYFELTLTKADAPATKAHLTSRSTLETEHARVKHLEYEKLISRVPSPVCEVSERA